MQWQHCSPVAPLTRHHHTRTSKRLWTPSTASRSPTPTAGSRTETLNQRPDLYRAVLCGFPDVDILRFPKYTTNNNAPALLEYGNSEIREHFEAIRKYSPYQNVRRNIEYPAVMFTTGDLDTRVPPLGARKMTARLQASTTSGYPIILRYHHKAGHAAGRGLPFSRRIVDIAMELTFLLQQLGVEIEPKT